MGTEAEFLRSMPGTQLARVITLMLKPDLFYTFPLYPVKNQMPICVSSMVNLNKSLRWTVSADFSFVSYLWICSSSCTVSVELGGAGSPFTTL